MLVKDLMRRSVAVVRKDASIRRAIYSMKEYHVGDVIVIDSLKDRAQRPVGILTDRDVVILLSEKDIDLDFTSVEKIMTKHPIIAHEDDDIFDSMIKMERAGIGRLPVVDDQNILIGVLTTDDLIKYFSNQALALTKLYEHRIEKERHLDA